MKALFITKPFFIEPLGIMCLIAAAKKDGHEVDLVTTDEDVCAKIQSFKPDVLCYSILTGDQVFYSELNIKLWSKFNLPAIAGGPHCTFFPEMIKELSFDFICVGEGEVAFPLFLERYGRLQKRGLDTDKIIAFNITSRKKQNPILPLINDLDAIAFPDRECVFKYDHIRFGPIKHFIAGRGCPYNCTYCFNAAYSKIYKDKGKRVRLRSPSNLMEEIKEVIIATPTELVYFQDDTFIIDKSWLADFLPRYKEFTLALPFHCHVRANLVDDEIAHMLADAGCRSVHLAIESGDQATRTSVLGRSMSDDMILNAVKCLKNHNILVMTQNILGLPFTTIDDDIKTLKLNQKCEPTYAWASIFQPYPKTKLGELAKETGLYVGDFSDIGNSFFDKTPLNLPEMHKIQIANLQKLFAVAVEHPEIFTEDLVRETISQPGFAEKPGIIDGYKRFRRMKDEELYGVKL
jgi:radical SAM superfamily enzyme YgiQ (UPF0313 family)